MGKHHQIQSNKKYPVWLKFTVMLMGLSLFFVVLSYGKFIIMPLAFAAFISMLLNPLVKLFEKWKIGRAASILLTLLVVLIVFGGMLSLISAQFLQFAERIPEVTEKLKNVSASTIQYLDETAGISQEEQTVYLQQGLNNMIDKSGQFMGSLVSATTNAFTTITLLPIFIFFMLYYRDMYVIFFTKIFERSGFITKVDSLIVRIQQVTQDYIIGLLTVIAFLAVLNATGLYLIGLDHAIFFGVFAALLAVIPFIGIIIGALPPLLFAFLLTDSLITPLLVIAVFGVVQFLEGNLITPRIVGSKVSINPFVAILALIIGGEIWGISGMILFVPLIGILKVVFDQISDLKPYGYLLGNTIDYKD